MGVTAPVHPTDPILQAYGLGKLDDVSAEPVAKHLESCPDCERRVAALSSDEFLGRLQNAQVKSDKSAADWPPFGVSATEGARGPLVPPPPVDTLPPELVDHPDYEIVRELGRGGMGVVYLARNKLMGRLEVLKVVGGQLVERPGVRDRFLREVQSAAKLQHKNIVAAYSATRLGESIVLAMEFIDGQDLAKMVKSRGPLPVVHACYFIHQAALGLQHAHERGMVHRDIKPANLIFAVEGKKGVVKVLDFGLAKVTSEGQADSGLTREGQMLGTPDYIAPEQIRDAQSADIRADIYSLGCTLYYLLTGGPPFRGDHLWDLYQAHFSMDASPLNLVRPEVPVELAAVVAKMMAKEPGRRFQTPGEVAQALTPFIKKGNVASTGSKPEFSQAGRPEAKQPTAGAGSVPTRPAAASAPAPRPSARKPVGTPPPDALCESLVDLRGTETTRDESPAIAPTWRPRWLWPSVAVGLLLLGFIAVWGVLIKIWTPEGFIVLRDLPDQALVVVDGKKATVHWPDGGGSAEITVAPGDYMVEVKKDGFTMKGQKVTVERGGRTTLVVELLPLETSLPKKGDVGPARPGVAEPPAPRATGALGTTSPKPPPTRAENPNTNPTIVVDDAGAKVEAAGRIANGPAQPQPTDAARALKGKAQICYGSWLVEGRELVQTDAAKGRGGEVLFGDLDWTDYDFTVDLLREEGNGAAALRFRRTLRNGNHLDFEMYGSDRNGGACGVIALEDGKERELRDGEFHFVNHKWYRARVSVRRNHIVCTLHDDGGNEVVHLEVDDDRLPSGQVGLGTENSSCRFKNIKVTAPDGKVLWEGLPDLPGQARGNGDLAAGVVGRPEPSPAVKTPSSRESIKNSIGMTLKLIPAGEFMMGSDATDHSAKDNEFLDAAAGKKEKHRVRITRPFYLGATEVTRGQFRRFVAATGYQTEAEWDGTGGSVRTEDATAWEHDPGYTWRTPGFDQTDEHPVVMVSWNDAQAFMAWLSRKEGKRYRLPTEAEWEYACRAGSNTRYSFGDDPEGLAKVGNLADATARARYPSWTWASIARDGHVYTAPVGRYSPNAWGLYDMYGNVWEWCFDGYAADYYRQSPVEDPRGVDGAWSRVLRGGAWDCGRNARSAIRIGPEPGNRTNVTGFRVARVQTGR